MSSFLEDLNSIDGTDDPSAGATDATKPGDSPFLVGLQESDASGASGRGKNTSAIALVIALVAGGGGLYAMRTVGLSASVALADTEIDYASKASPASLDHAAMIDDLRRTGEVVQVPLTELPINPFAWNAVQPVEEAEPDPVVAEVQEDPSERRRRERERRVRETISFLTLNSVVGGRRPVVRISGEIYTLGDSVEDIFTLERVEGRTVVLTADGKEFKLSIGE